MSVGQSFFLNHESMEKYPPAASIEGIKEKGSLFSATSLTKLVKS